MGLTEEQSAAVGRLKDAVSGIARGTRKDRPGKMKGTLVQHGHLADVQPADVVAACDAVPEGDRSRIVRDLRLGSANVLEAKEMAGDEKLIFVKVYADDVHHLLDEVAKAAAAPGV